MARPKAVQLTRKQKQIKAREEAGLGPRELNFDFAAPSTVTTGVASQSRYVSNSSHQMIRNQAGDDAAKYAEGYQSVRRSNIDPLHYDREGFIGNHLKDVGSNQKGLYGKKVLKEYGESVNPDDFKGMRQSEARKKIESDLQTREIDRRAAKLGGKRAQGSNAQEKATESFNRDKQQMIRENSTVPMPSVKDGSFDAGMNQKLMDGLNPGQKYAMNKAINKYNSVEQMVQKGGMESTVKKQMGFKDDAELDKFMKSSEADRARQYSQGTNKAIEKPGMMNMAMGYKVPHMAMGALGTAGLVSAMSGSKGQQSNAQLYGQQQPYY